jgi:hypothetical protein
MTVMIQLWRLATAPQLQQRQPWHGEPTQVMLFMTKQGMMQDPLPQNSSEGGGNQGSLGQQQQQ